MTVNVLLVDDDPVQRRLTQSTLQRFGFEPFCVEDGDQALFELIEKQTKFDAIILDLVMPGTDGFTVIQKLKQNNIHTPVLVQTSQGSIDSIISAMRMGATDFLVKPVSPERLQVSLTNALKVNALEDEVKTLRATNNKTGLSFKDLISTSDEMISAVRLGQKAAQSNIPVLLEGETGVGKEVFARAIQGASERANKPLIAVNCGALPLNLVESILFGHEKGAFTGATEKHSGKFVEANEGTIFLDEVGELPMEAQTRLLRVLQTGEVDAVGAKKSTQVNVRVISATNVNLIEAVREGKFREDLYYRLAVFPILIPPLRKRKSDIPALARRFLARFAAEENKNAKSITPEAIHMLMTHNWPGNIRELENAMFRAVVLSDLPEITIRDLPHLMFEETPSTLQTSHTSILSHTANSTLPDVALNRPNITLLNPQGHLLPLADLEKQIIKFALSHYQGQMSEVARRLEIGRSTLYRKLEEHGLKIEGAA